MPTNSAKKWSGGEVHAYGLALLAARLFRVPLRAQPSDTAIAVHPLFDFGFAFETLNVDWLYTRIFGKDIPVALVNSDRLESYSCFGHGPL